MSDVDKTIKSEHERMTEEGGRRQRLAQELQAHPRLLEAQQDIWAEQDVERDALRRPY